MFEHCFVFLFVAGDHFSIFLGFHIQSIASFQFGILNVLLQNFGATRSVVACTSFVDVSQMYDDMHFIVNNQTKIYAI